jgi:hypothetical protein
MKGRLRYTIILQEEEDRNGNYIGLESFATAPIEHENGEIKDTEVIRVNGSSYPDVLLRVACNIIAWEMGLKPVYKRSEPKAKHG